MTTQPWHDQTLSAEERALLALNAMTLEEKVAQLGSHWEPPEGDVEPPEGGDNADVAPMMAAMGRSAAFETVVVNGIGHITRAYGSAPHPLAENVQRLRERQEFLASQTRLGIPAIVHEECLTGFMTRGATAYPTPLAWGATFSPELIADVGAAIGRDMAAVGVHQGLSPVLDVVRDYRWGRVEETIGEDPFLVGEIGSAYVAGLESAGVVSTLKHFAGYSASRAGRNHAPVSMGQRELADVILPPFEKAIRVGGARSVMNSYADVDGVPAGASKELLTDILREQWGFTGTVVSDYWTVPFLMFIHRIAADPVSAAAAALTAGLDVELPDSTGFAGLGAAVSAGLPEALIDRAALRVLVQKAQLGLLDENPVLVPEGAERVDLDHRANHELARAVAERSIILLANDGVLPLASPRKVALVGPVADSTAPYLGCYSFESHIMSLHPELGPGITLRTLRAVLEDPERGLDVRYAQGVPFRGTEGSDIGAAVEAARGAEVAIVAVGDQSGLFGRGTSGEGCDASDLRLPGAQEDLVRAVLDTGVPTVIVVSSGRPYALGEFAERAAAIVQAFLPGQEGAEAIADVLTGAVTPSGRLPVSIPRHPYGQPGTYLAPVLATGHFGISSIDPRPLFPFGHGLSYTSFAHGTALTDAQEIPTDGTVELRVSVRNTGGRDGAEVVQVYAEYPKASVVRPVQQLIGFARVELAAGEQKTVAFRVHADLFAVTGIERTRIVEPGVVNLSVGRSVGDLTTTATITLTGPVRTVTPGQGVIETPVTVFTS